jgi:hypothetical protein
MRVPELEKPKDKWCPHCVVGKGCGIYEERPASCRDFFCAYLLDDKIAEHWRPSQSRMVLNNRVETIFRVLVDPDRPNAWRQQPYYGDIKKWAANAVRMNRVVVVHVGDSVTVILHDRDKAFGKLAPGEQLRLVKLMGPKGPEYDVERQP